MKKEIYIIGAGTYGEAMFELADILGYDVKSFYDEDDNKLDTMVMDVKVIDKVSNLDENTIKNKNFIVAIGENKIRQEIMEKINTLGGLTPTLIHPLATISPSAIIGNGVYIQANAYIWTKVRIDDYTIISPNVVICHHTSIGKACLISNVSGIGASIEVKDRVFIGMGCTIATGINVVGENSIIGAGGVLLEDVDKNCVYAGIPAKKIRSL